MSDSEFDKVLKEYFKKEKAPESTTKLIRSALENVEVHKTKTKRKSKTVAMLNAKTISIVSVLILVIIFGLNVVISDNNEKIELANSGTFYEKIFEGRENCLDSMLDAACEAELSCEPGFLIDTSDLIIDAQVVQIGPSSNYIEETNCYTDIFTNVSLKVLNVIENNTGNDIPEDITLEIRGGAITVEQYNKNPNRIDLPESKNKNNNGKYVFSEVHESVEKLQEGKEYTLYLEKSPLFANRYLLICEATSIIQK